MIGVVTAIGVKKESQKKYILFFMNSLQKLISSLT
jgi:hypothetical protein